MALRAGDPHASCVCETPSKIFGLLTLSRSPRSISVLIKIREQPITILRLIHRVLFDSRVEICLRLCPSAIQQRTTCIEHFLHRNGRYRLSRNGGSQGSCRVPERQPFGRNSIPIRHQHNCRGFRRSSKMRNGSFWCNN